MGLRIIGIDLDGLAQGLNGCVRMVPREFRLPQTQQSVSVARVGFESGVKVRFCVIELRIIQQDLTEVTGSRHGIAGKALEFRPHLFLRQFGLGPAASKYSPGRSAHP